MPSPAMPSPAMPSPPEDDELKQVAGIVADITNVGNTNDGIGDSISTSDSTSGSTSTTIDDGLGQEWWDNF